MIPALPADLAQPPLPNFDDFIRDGCGRVDAVVSATVIAEMSAMSGNPTSAGVRLSLKSPLAVNAAGFLGPLARAIRTGARPVRALLLDKTPLRNWSVPWHQDRTIAVAARADAAGFGPWSIKAGVAHVEPPFALLSAMLTLRLHLDDCDDANGPLRVALGSHCRRVEALDVGGVVAQSTQLSCLAAAGDVWMYATPILHASIRAARPSRRRVVQLDYSADDLPAGLRWAT